MLIDSDVLIWMTRGHAGATERLQTLLPWQISAVTYMELVQAVVTEKNWDGSKKG